MGKNKSEVIMSLKVEAKNKRRLAITIYLSLISILGGLIMLKFLPEMVASHGDFAFNINKYMPRTNFYWFIAFLSIFYWVVFFATRKDKHFPLAMLLIYIILSLVAFTTIYRAPEATKLIELEVDFVSAVAAALNLVASGFLIYRFDRSSSKMLTIMIAHFILSLFAIYARLNVGAKVLIIFFEFMILLYINLGRIRDEDEKIKN